MLKAIKKFLVNDKVRCSDKETTTFSMKAEDGMWYDPNQLDGYLASQDTAWPYGIGTIITYRGNPPKVRPSKP